MRRLAFATVLVLTAFGAAATDVIVRGVPIRSTQAAVPIEAVLEAPESYAKKPVVVDGVVAMACTRKGCWMELVPAVGEPGMRITFKDYAFFVPLDSKGMLARAEGVTKVRTLSKKEADHLAEEGAKLTRNADGTAREVSFVANGVQLRRPAR